MGGGDRCFQISGLLGSHECKCLYLDHLVSVNTDNGQEWGGECGHSARIVHTCNGHIWNGLQ